MDLVEVGILLRRLSNFVWRLLLTSRVSKRVEMVTFGRQVPIPICLCSYVVSLAWRDARNGVARKMPPWSGLALLLENGCKTSLRLEMPNSLSYFYVVW